MFLFFLFCFGVFCIAISIYLSQLQKKNSNERKLDEQKISKYISLIANFKCIDKIIGINTLGKIDKLIAIDEENSKLALITKDNFNIKHKIYSFDQIISTEIIEDEISITRYSKSGAIIGGVIAGGAGAIIGGLGNKKSSDKVKKLGLKIVLDSIIDPEFILYQINTVGAVNKTSYAYLMSKKAIDNWYNIITVAIKRGEKAFQPSINT